jgi:hypothetical protein
MTEFFANKLVDTLPEMDNYILDFAVFDDGSVLVIELNPWATTSGAALFQWSADRSVLMNGPMEFRIVEEPVEGVQESLFPEIKSLIQRVSQETEEARPREGLCCLQ